MRRQDVHDELRARLHAAAEAHEPDRARILARVERGMTEEGRPGRQSTRPPASGWFRVAGATAAVAGVLAVGGYAVASAVKDDTPARQTVAVSPTPRSTSTPSPDATTRPPVHSSAPTAGSGRTARPSHEASPSATTPAPRASATTRAPGARGTQDGPLWSDGSVDPHSNDFWAQSDITLKTSKQLTALTVRLEVARTGGVSTAGAWSSLPETDFTQTVEEKDGFLVYTWALKQGRRVPAGQWVFAGQYNHERGGRDAKDDGYTATAASGGAQYTVTGDFAAHGPDDGGS